MECYDGEHSSSQAASVALFFAGQKLAPQPGLAVDAAGAGKEEISNDNSRGLIPVHVGGSARPFPAIQEENEEEEEGGGEKEEDMGPGGEGEEGSHREEDPEQLLIPCQSEEERGGKGGGGGQGGNGGEEEDRHLRAAKEWEQIDQVGCGVVNLCVSSLCASYSRYGLGLGLWLLENNCVRARVRNVGNPYVASLLRYPLNRDDLALWFAPCKNTG